MLKEKWISSINRRLISKTDIEVNNSTEVSAVTDDDDIAFLYKSIDNAVADCPVVTVATVLREKKVRDVVSLHVYVIVDNRPVVPTMLKYSSKSVDKKEVSANDDTGIIKLTLWSNTIADVPTSGVYLLEQVTVREWPQGVLSITTSPKTTIRPSDKAIKKSKSVLPELLSFSVKFPPISVVSVQSQSVSITCPRCDRITPNSDGRLFKCSHCNAMALFSPLQRKFVVKLAFHDATNKVITCFSQQVEDYFKQRCMDMPVDVEELVLVFLSDDSTRLIYDSRYVCIGLEM